MVNKDTLYLFGGRNSQQFALLKSSDGGMSWDTVFTCDSCGYNQDQQYVVGSGLFFSADVGENLTAVFHQPENSDTVIALVSLTSVSGQISFFDNRNGIVLGQTPTTGGVSLHATTDAGATWETRSFGTGYDAAVDWMEFKDLNTGLVRLSSTPEYNYSAVLRTSDGGKSWSQVSSGPSRFYHYELNR